MIDDDWTPRPPIYPRDDDWPEDAKALLDVNEDAAKAEISRLRAELARKDAALQWYAENARLCRIIHMEGDKGRYALAEDGGKRARAALEPPMEGRP